MLQLSAAQANSECFLSTLLNLNSGLKDYLIEQFNQNFSCRCSGEHSCEITALLGFVTMFHFLFVGKAMTAAYLKKKEITDRFCSQ
jgi:hypothetical protein